MYSLRAGCKCFILESSQSMMPELCTHSHIRPTCVLMPANSLSQAGDLVTRT